jgi:hypothetical protein
MLNLVVGNINTGGREISGYTWRVIETACIALHA